MNNKVGLCIVYKNWNYGSILQSYATLIELREIGIDYEIIKYERKKNLKFYIFSLPRLLSQDMVYTKVRSFKRKIGRLKHNDFVKNDNIRVEKFKEFITYNFDKFSQVITDYETLKMYANKFQSVIVGSDQLWLPAGLATNFFNLMFVPDSVRKIAYAASFGVSVIPSRQKAKTIEYLNRIDYISVREHSGQKIIKELIGKEVPVIVDPTLVISKEQWDKYIPQQRLIDDDYVFCYFLGDNPSQRDEAKKLAREKGLKIVTLRHLDEYISSDETFGDYAPYNVGPAEFVNLIRFAKYVCTDSFHGSVFSLINHKQFISFNRYAEGANSRNSRLDTLFVNAGINRRFSGDIIKEMLDPIDYVQVDKNLEKCRQYAKLYIEGALNDRD